MPLDNGTPQDNVKDFTRPLAGLQNVAQKLGHRDVEALNEEDIAGSSHDVEEPLVTIRPVDTNIPMNDPRYDATCRLPEKRTRKICIVGTAPQWMQAPFEDTSVEIWTIFGLACTGKRINRLYEVHDRAIILDMAKKAAVLDKYLEVANSLKENYIAKDAWPEVPAGARFDFAAKRKRYGDYFASSAAWLLADAIDEILETGDLATSEITIFGINMAAEEEYAHQKPSMTYLIGWARAKGIRVAFPSSSELLLLTHQYGLEQPPRFHAGIAQKKIDIQNQLNIHENNRRASELGAYGCTQALAMLDYVEKNWKA